MVMTKCLLRVYLSPCFFTARFLLAFLPSLSVVTILSLFALSTEAIIFSLIGPSLLRAVVVYWKRHVYLFELYFFLVQ